MEWNKLLNGGRLRESNRKKEGDARNDFESDLGRIIFSSAMRRMHDKTQVFPLTADDNIHSRLTHSMEVMAIGYSLGIIISDKLNKTGALNESQAELYRSIPIILKNACLVHDIGNPPFGHFGETVIQNYFKDFFEKDKVSTLSEIEKDDFRLFDGNAQGFRVLTKQQILDDEFGLNLTYSTLGAYLKYPNSGSIEKETISKKKRGVFQSEKKYLEKIAQECGLIVDRGISRHPLCYLMEAADSICYLIMDIEDGFNKKWYDFEFIVDRLVAVPGIAEQVVKLNHENKGWGMEITKMVKFRIYLIQRLVNVTVDNFISNLTSILNGDYQKELIFDDSDRLAKELQKFCFAHIFPSREITSLELTGHSVLTGLLNYFIKFTLHPDKHYRSRIQGLISSSVLKIAFLENKLPECSTLDDLNEYYKLRVIVDYISGMTDQFALNQFQQLSGQKII